VLEEFLRVLDRVVGRLSAMYQAPREYGTGIPLYGTEIHTIQAIGESAGITVTRLAEKRGVTKGAVSQTLSKLVGKGLVRKTHAPDNAKEVVLELTERGWIGFRNHGTFDMKVLDSVRAYCGADLKTKLNTFLSVMTDFDAILTLHEQRHQSAGSTKENG